VFALTRAGLLAIALAIVELRQFLV